MVSEYIVNIGVAAEQEIKTALTIFFLERFTREGTFDGSACPEDQTPQYLAASAAMNVVLGEIDLLKSSKEGSGTVEAYARESVHESTVRFAAFGEKNPKRVSWDSLMRVELARFSLGPHTTSGMVAT